MERGVKSLLRLLKGLEYVLVHEYGLYQSDSIYPFHHLHNVCLFRYATI